jgi:hypothetical protein
LAREKAERKAERLRKKKEEEERLAEKARKRKLKEEKAKKRMEEKLKKAMETGYLRWTNGFERRSVYWKQKEDPEAKSDDSCLMVDPVDFKDVLGTGHKLRFDPQMHSDPKLAKKKLSDSRSNSAASRRGSSRKKISPIKGESLPKIKKIQSSAIKKKPQGSFVATEMSKKQTEVRMHTDGDEDDDMGMLQDTNSRGGLGPVGSISNIDESSKQTIELEDVPHLQTGILGLTGKTAQPKASVAVKEAPKPKKTGEKAVEKKVKKLTSPKASKPAEKSKFAPSKTGDAPAAKAKKGVKKGIKKKKRAVINE